MKLNSSNTFWSIISRRLSPPDSAPRFSPPIFAEILAPGHTLRTMFDGDPTERSGYSFTERWSLTLLLANKSKVLFHWNKFKQCLICFLTRTFWLHWFSIETFNLKELTFDPIPDSIKAKSWKQTRACSLSVLDKRPYSVQTWKYRHSTTFGFKTTCCSVFGGPLKWVIYIINEWVDNNGVFYSATDVYGFQGFPL